MLDKARTYYQARSQYYSAVLIVNVIAMAVLTSIGMDQFVLFAALLLIYALGLHIVLVRELLAEGPKPASAFESPAERARYALRRTGVLTFSILYALVLIMVNLLIKTS